jgi:hypothetical protein
MPVFLSLLVALLLMAIPANSQEANARISGVITDSSKALVPNAGVVAVNKDTNVRFSTKTNGSGVYVLPGLPIGEYRIEVEHIGFKSIVEASIILHTQDALELNFEMAVGSASETVTVNAGATNDSPAVSMTVDREFVESMPLNGRSFQDLIQLAPGTVDAQNGGSSTGYYSIDGQRQDSNNFTVDGVSANLGGLNNAAGVGNYEAGISGSSPAQTVVGTTQSLASVDSLEEFTIQTSGYTAEYGRSPGGQVQLTTRSGTNDLHGTVYDYFRNTALDANTWANGYYDQPQEAEHQNDFGGTFGGPLMLPKLYSGKDRTFYFLSYEGLRLLLPNFEEEYNPTQAIRSWASPNVQPFLNWVPLPNGPDNADGCTIPNSISACDGLFTYGYSYPNNLDNYSVRLDHSAGKRLHAFVRYAYTPSTSAYGAESTSTSVINVRSLTAGITDKFSPSLLNEVRFNYSTDVENSLNGMQSVDGSTPLPRQLVIPSDYEGTYAATVAYVQIPGTSLDVGAYYGGSGTRADQYNLIDSLAWTKGAHSIKFGVDWRRFISNFTSLPFESQIYIGSLTDVQQGNVTELSVSATAPGVPIFDNFSLYAQDHLKIHKRLTFDYGLRWEFDPPPGPSNGKYPVVLTSNNLSTATLAPLGTKPYKTYYDKFAPRFGFAWNATRSEKHPLTVRGAFGIYFDTGQQTIGGAYAGGYPFGAQTPVENEVPLPLTDTELAPPSLNVLLTPPYPNLNELTSTNLTLPYTEQWNFSLDEVLNSQNTFTASYVGNNGEKLLFTSAYLRGILQNAEFPNEILFTSNAAHSTYDALQVQDVGRIVSGIEFVGSFTWAHALDNASNDFSAVVPMWGNSDNDLRRVLNLAVNYQTTAVGASNWMQTLTHGWTLANRFSTQSGNPLLILQRREIVPDGTEERIQPNLVPGIPIYLHGSAAELNGQPAPGNWLLNRAAFACTTNGATSGACPGGATSNGNLGRNFIRTPPFWTLNTSLQRSFPIYERLHLNFRVDAFNVLNHPNLNQIDNGLSDSTFGEATYEGTIGSSNQLYAMGAARSLQLSLKLQF